MRRFVSKPVTANVPPKPSESPASQDALPGASLDIDALLSKASTILQREISNLMMESSGKKLSPPSARDLVAYIKLLSELKSTQADELSEMTDEQLLLLSSQDLKSK